MSIYNTIRAQLNTTVDMSVVNGTEMDPLGSETKFPESPFQRTKSTRQTERELCIYIVIGAFSVVIIAIALFLVE